MIRLAARLVALALCTASCGGGNGSVAADAGANACSATVDAQVECPGAVATCDYFLHCGCDPADKCTAGAVGPTCAPAGDKPVGDACASDSECGRGTVCVPVFGTTRCLQFCDDAHRCRIGEACYFLVEDQHQPASTIGQVCAPTCSLVGQDCPTVDLGCYRSEKNCAAEEGICLTAGAGAQGTSCTRMSDCQKGYLCIDPGGSPPPICAKICDRKDGVPACDAGTLCQRLPGQTQTGVCLP